MNGVGGGEVGGLRMGLGRGHGIMEPTEAAARKGVERAPPSLILPSDQIFYRAHSHRCGLWGVPTALGLRI